MDVTPRVPSSDSSYQQTRSSVITGSLTLALTLVLAACGGAAPAGNPDGGTGGVPDAPAAPAPRPATGSLADLLPLEIDGQPLEHQAGTGQAGLELLDNADVDDVTEQLERLRVPVDQLSVAEAGDIDAATDEAGIGIVAVRVPGVLFTPSSGPQTRFVSSLLGIQANARVGYATLANRTTTTILDPAGSTKTYVYGPTEVIFIVRGPENLVEEAFSKLSLRP
ncbi:hypothetical protein BH24CHL6_BH24CHL6_08640 [soil metagenome]